LSTRSDYPSESTPHSEVQPELPQQSNEVHREPRSIGWGDVFSKLFWVSFCGLAAFGVWQIGPQLVENYQFAVTKGKIRAEHQFASDVLAENPLQDISKAYQFVAQKIRPSVVSIRCDKTIINKGRRPTRGEGQGSGVVMASDGYILTSAHVVKGGTDILVTLFDKRQFVAEVVGADELSDLAVLKIPARDLITADWGDSDLMEVGSPVWAIGSPFGLEYTVTSGIISGKNRVEQKPTPGDRSQQSPHQELLQTDAAVNPGNSGGPLVDSTGSVVGINSSIVGEQFLGISFAIPSSIAKFIFDELISSGSINRGFFGFDPDPVYQSDAERVGLPDLNGALVNWVRPNSPAQRAGLRRGDVIRSWNGQEITEHAMVFRYSLTTPPRTQVDLVVFRDGQERSTTLTVGERDDSRASTRRRN
jgi:serine protease Do